MDPATAPLLLPQPDSDNSSPRSATTWDDQPLPGAKLRLMCSYGGHIVPRPHDKSLCYVGGETRIVVVDRQSSMAEFHSRLSHTLLNGRQFSLKYQLPNEDLDSLVSLATDEDLENMVHEYDRTTTCGPSPLKPSRLRLFLFPSKPETASSMGSLLDDAKSETWFVDALNGSAFLPRGLSDSAAIITDNLLELAATLDPNTDQSRNQDDETGKMIKNNATTDAQDAQQQQVLLIVGGGLDSPASTMSTALEMNSSLESGSSSPSTSNLPPIKVKVQDGEFSVHTNLSGGGENLMISGQTRDDEEKSLPPLPSGMRKPPLPLQPVQRKLIDNIHNLPSPDYSSNAALHNLPSPDSVASDDCSNASAGSVSKHTTISYQDAYSQYENRENRVPLDPKATMMMVVNTTQEPSSSQIPIHQFGDSIHTIPHQNQQFIHPNLTPQYNNNNNIQHQFSSAIPPSMSSSYYPMYHHHHLPLSLQHQTEQQQYAMYLVPPLTQASQTNDHVSGRPSTPPPNPAVPYNQMKPEMAANAYANIDAHQMLVQVPHQFQQQYMGIPPPQSQQTHANAANYRHEYVQDQVYYTHKQQSAVPPPQYQTMTPAAALLLSQPSANQLPNPDNNNPH